MSRHPFRDLSTIIDGVHALIDGWAESDALAPALDRDGIEVLRLALHEWIANLVQHAAFPNGVEIVVRVEPDDESVFCAVEDSSVGFDFAGQVERQQAILDAPAPSERGRGLLMLITCTENLSFQPAAAGSRQCVSFRVRGAATAPLLASLFRPEDLVGEGAFDGGPLDADAFADDAFGGPALGGDGLDTHATDAHVLGHDSADGGSTAPPR